MGRFHTHSIPSVDTDADKKSTYTQTQPPVQHAIGLFTSLSCLVYMYYTYRRRVVAGKVKPTQSPPVLDHAVGNDAFHSLILLLLLLPSSLMHTKHIHRCTMQNNQHSWGRRHDLSSHLDNNNNNLLPPTLPATPAAAPAVQIAALPPTV